MPFDWNNFLTLAEELATKTDEASQRTAISRAYYCVFNLALARAKSKGRFPPRNTPTHQWCWDQYKGTVDPTCQQLGNTGERMKRMRVDADYKATKIPRLDDEVEKVLQEAHELLAGLTALDPKYPRP
jgi:uncharacterized protein (UPF0332 family)